MSLTAPLEQKNEKLYLNIRVHHLSYYHIDLTYTKDGRPKTLDIKLVMTNFLSTPNMENSKRKTVVGKFYSHQVNEHMFLPLFNSFEKYIKTILTIDNDQKKLKKARKRHLVDISKEEYKQKLKDFERRRSATKKEIKKLLLELFSE